MAKRPGFTAKRLALDPLPYTPPGYQWVGKWRTVHAALRMTALTIQAARDAGDSGVSDPRSFSDLAPLVWSQGVARD